MKADHLRYHLHIDCMPFFDGLWTTTVVHRPSKKGMQSTTANSKVLYILSPQDNASWKCAHCSQLISC